MKKEKGVSLLELILALVIIGFMCASFASVHMLLAKTYKTMEQELGEYTAVGSHTLEFMCQRIIRADETEVQNLIGSTLTGRTLRIHTPLATPAEGIVTLVGNELRYFAGAASVADITGSGQLLAKNVKNITFKHDYQSEVTDIIGNPRRDGVSAPVFYLTFKSPPRVGMTLVLGDATHETTMQTAAVPRVAPNETRTVRYLSPVVTGELLEVKELRRDCYALVKADAIAIHTKGRFQSLDGQLFYVEIPLNLARALESKIGEQIAFMGDILTNVEGKPTMKMNRFYGGGVLVGKEAVEAMCRKIDAGQEAWYETESLHLKGVLEEAKKSGTDISDWEQTWQYLQRYYQL